MSEKINIKPFELSLWKDELEPYTIEQLGDYLNIYQGLGTPEDDLRFWFLPRDWKYGSFTQVNNSVNKVHLNMKKSDERDEGLVHLDFSTSILPFKPNTYYTFLLTLDFKNGNTTYKKPSWAAYAAANPAADNHYLLALLREEVPDSQWNMPKSAFDSTVVIKYDNQGFNLSGTRFSYDYEDAELFVDTSGSTDGDIADADKVILIACAKTNDFVNDNSVLGMWSFLEGWVNDYWEADMQLYCFEESIENNEPVIYTKLFNYYKPNIYEPVVLNKINENFYYRFLKLFPDTTVGETNKNPFNMNNEALQTCKKLIDEKIREYYTTLRNSLKKGRYTTSSPPSYYNSQVERLKNEFISDYILEETDESLNLSFNAKNIDYGKQIAEILHRYLSIFPFYYYEKIDNSYELQPFYYSQSTDMVNFFTDYFGNYTYYKNRIESLIIQDICLPISFKELENNLETASERGAIYLNNGNSIDTIEYTFINSDLTSNTSSYKNSVIDFFNTSFIEGKIQLFWDKFFDGVINKLKEVFEDSYLYDALQENNPLKTEYDLTNNNGKMNIKGYDIAYRYGSLMLLDNVIITQLTTYINNIIKPNSNYLGESQFGYLLILLGSWGLGFSTEECSNQIDINNTFLHYNKYEFMQKKINISRSEERTQYIYGPVTGTRYKNWIIDIANNVDNRIDLLMNMNLLSAPIESNKLYNDIDVETRLYDYPFLREKRICVFGSSDNKPSFAQNIIFDQSTKDNIHTINFSLYYDYYNQYGEKEKNPFIPLLKEESKIKLKYDDKWYDFIIKEVNLDSFAKKVDYVAKDAFVLELSKIGFEKTFNSELDNNVGTITELSDKILENTGWEIDKTRTDTFYQSIKKNVIGGYLKNNYKIKCTSYYYDEDLKKVNLNSNYIIQNDGSSERTYIYLFYENGLENSSKPKVICVKAGISPYKHNYTTLNNILTNVYLYPNYVLLNGNNEEVDLEFVNYNVLANDENTITIKTLNIFDNNNISLNYGLRALDIVTKEILHYSSPLKRYVTEYTKNENGTNKTMYGFSIDSYTTTPLVQNLLPNGEDFTSLTGWITGSVNRIFTTKMTLGAATSNITNDILPYINFRTSLESGSNSLNNSLPHGFICNTALGLNYAALDHLTPKENFTLRVQLERGQGYQAIQNNSNADIDDQLTLMESIRPHLYFYDDEYTLQNQYSTSILPRKDQQVVNFYQEQKYKDLCAYNAGYGSSTWASNNSSSIGNSIFSLSDTLNKYGLVPIYSLKSNNAQNNISGLTVSGQQFKYSNSGSYIFSYFFSDYPCAYVTRNLAEYWTTNSHLTYRIVPTNGAGCNTAYCFGDTGHSNFIKLFNSNDSAFNLRDFFIIADCSYYTDNANHSRNIMCNYVLTASSGRLYYYLPMLFNDNEIEQILTDKGYSGSVTKNKYNKELLNLNSGSPKWQDVFKTKEYYFVTQISSKNRCIPYNCNIEFDELNSNIGSIPAKSDSTVYNDFDSLMKMRSIWRVRRYSESGTCIFETDGTFWGKVFKKADGTYVYKDTQNKSSGYSYEDLNALNLGLFFCIDSTKYDDGARGNAFAALSKIELFRTYYDEDGELILPNKVIDVNTTPIYKFYDPVKNEKITQEYNIDYDYVGTYIPLDSSTGKPIYNTNIDYNGERKNSITITDSNCYNLLQKLAEIFDGWLNFDVLHNEDGSLVLDENNYYRPIKKIYFTKTNYNNNYAGIKYGINLNKIQRKIDSNDLITKLIVKNNNNEFGLNGFCSIARSGLNSNGTNSILRFEHLVNTGVLPPQIIDNLYNDIYPRARSLSRYLNQTILDLTHQSIIIAQEKAAKEYNEQLIAAAKSKFADFMEQYSRLNLSSSEYSLAYYIANKSARDSLPSEIQTIINSLMFYSGLISGFTRRTLESKNSYNDALRKYNVLSNSVISVTMQRDAIMERFYDLCRSYVKEGAWSSEDYIDDDLYYLDAERQAEEYAVPRVTYTIDVVDISALPEFKNYNFNLRDKTYIEDPDVFGYYLDGTPVQEEIIITGKSIHLQEPEKNTITVQNYKTQFTDLFQRINSVIQAVEFGTLNYSNKNSDNSPEKRINENTLSIQVLQKINNK